MIKIPDYSMPLVAIDVETTGLHPFTSEIIEVGAVKFFLDQTKTETYSSFIRPSRSIPPSATAIHGITDDMVSEAPLFENIASDLYDFFSDSILVAHNAMFDISFFQFSGMLHGKPFPETYVIDTLTMTREIFSNLPRHSLTELVYLLEIKSGSLHRALADAHACKEIFLKALNKFQSNNSLWESFTELYLFHTSDWQIRGNIPSEMMPLVDACRHGIDVFINYVDSRGTQSKRRITPIQMLRIRHVPYLIGYCHLRGALRNFRLDRISSWQIE